MTVDVKGSGPLWLKLRDLADGITYNFRIRAKTFMYGPEVEANITTGPGEGSGHEFSHTRWRGRDPTICLETLPSIPQELQVPLGSPSSHATARP